MCNFRTLRADEVECRVSKVGDGYVTCLLYKTARTDMDLLDETVQPMNWTVDYQEVKGNLYCTISIKDKDGNWIRKQNCGIESKQEDGNEKKAEASDAMKRAGFCWGIGRELYTAPVIFIRCKTKDDKGNKINHYYNVDTIEYNSKRRISKLVITEKGQEVFHFEEDVRPQPEPTAGLLRVQILSLANGDLERVNAFLNRFFGTEGQTLDDIDDVRQLLQLKVAIGKKVAG